MRVLKIQQNSEEWLEFRKGKSGGSDFKNLWIPGLPLKAKVVEKLESNGQEFKKTATVGELASMLEPSELAELKLDSEPKEHYYQIIADEVARPITPNDYEDRLNGMQFSMMARGHILEPEAIKAFEEETGKKVDAENGVWISDYNDMAYVSPDGSITDEDGIIREAVEVKCLDSPKVIKAYLTNHYPEEYKSQILKYFMVNENLEVLHFLVYTDVIPGLELQIFDIKREDVANGIADAMAFEIEVLKRIKADIEKIESLGF